MSRHRNVKNLIEEDDYYDVDYDYDYYEEDYCDDYDDYRGNKSYSQHVKQQQQKQPQKQPQQQKQQANKPPQKQQQLPSKKPTTTAASAKAPAACKITKPPPGWGKPVSNSNNDTKSTAAAAATPNSTTPATSSTPSIASTRVSSTSQTPATTTAPGIAAPPRGWGKPSSDTKAKTDQNVPAILLQHNNFNTEQQLSMVVIGHVDAGKSTMMGQLLYQVGQVTKRQATKISNSNSNTNAQTDSNNSNNIQWAWILDEDHAERARGVTMQIATKAISTPKHPRIVLLDAPGHADFVPTMITGAANADAALLVVDASAESAFEAAFQRGGQTKEHILLARGLGVSQLVVCVNKLDVRNWSQQVFQDICSRLLPFLTGMANFKEKRIQFVPTSGLTGANVKDPQTVPPQLKNWYHGPTLFKAIDQFQPVKQATLDQPVRIILSDVYAEGRGVAARGRVVQGFLQVGEKVVVLPIADEATVNQIDHLHALETPELHQYAVVGQTVDLTLTGVDPARVSTGSILARPNLTARPSIAHKLQAKIAVMEELTLPIIRGAQVLFHIQNLDVPAVVTKLISTTKRNHPHETRNQPRAVTAGYSAVVKITLSNPICIEPYSQCRALGRFVLRRSGDTIAVGVIEEVFAS